MLIDPGSPDPLAVYQALVGAVTPRTRRLGDLRLRLPCGQDLGDR